jgi:hypothetical protein
MTPLLHALRRGLRAVLLALAAAVIFIEEWGWRPLVACVAFVARWPPLARFENLLRRAPPPVALVLFVVPAVLLFPVKLGALWLIHRGQATLGLALIVLAKVLGTALVGRLFVLTEAQLLHYAWFARALGWWRTTKERVKAAVRRSAAWRMAHLLRRRVKVMMRRFAR